MMKHHVKWLIPVLAVFLMNQAARAVEIGEIPPKVELKEKLGGRLDGEPWSSEELQGKVHVLFYVDPDEKDTNNDASEALDREKFPGDKFQSVGIINMAATWLPNFAISSALKDKQKRYPRTTYVRDYKKVLVNAWKIADDSSDVLAFDKKGRLIFRKDGKLTAEEIQSLIKVIRDHL
ncbi:MAG: YtfJ family protein [Syntrophales bacterium]